MSTPSAARPPTTTASPTTPGRDAPPSGPDAPPPGRTGPTALAARPSGELAIAARLGDRAAAGELYRRVLGRARRAAGGFCLPADADDAVAEGLSRALRQLGQLRDPGAVEAWMVRCVVRCAIDLSRQRRRQRPTDAIERLIEGPGGESAAEGAMSALEQAAMAEAVRQLQPGPRLLLYLRYEAGLSVQHIALALGKPPGTVRRQCVEARRMAGQRFLSCHLRPAVGACAQVTELLCQEHYRRPATTVLRRTTQHLRQCRACRDRQAELAAVLTELGHRRDRRP